MQYLGVYVNCSLIVHVLSLHAAAVCCYMSCVLPNAQDKFLPRETIKAYCIVSHRIVMHRNVLHRNVLCRIAS